MPPSSCRLQHRSFLFSSAHYHRLPRRAYIRSCTKVRVCFDGRMTLTSYVAQLLGLYLTVAGILMIVREQAMMNWRLSLSIARRSYTFSAP